MGNAPKLHKRTTREIQRQRRYKGHSCWDHIIVAPLWPLHGVNLGTMLRTCDAAGACLAVPRYSWVPEALERGNTLKHHSCVHWVHNQVAWLTEQHEAGAYILGVELVDEAIRLADLPLARQRTVIVLGHERTGIPPEAISFLDDAVEIPMMGAGLSLNVAVAGSLVLYKIAGLS
jgi:tRNA (guanosine-2'-O-)-methyltransferase